MQEKLSLCSTSGLKVYYCETQKITIYKTCSQKSYIRQNCSVALPKSDSGSMFVRACTCALSWDLWLCSRFAKIFFFFCCQCGCIQLWQAAWLHTGISKAWSVPQEWSCTENRLALVFTSSLELPIYRGHKGSPKQWLWNGCQRVARQQYSPSFYISKETHLF